ncbi:DUF1992 domain-containing protein [Micromonospora sp. NPDC049282]|uniref:DnaJ family domain-containing protein n=1 Tax=Micromonospora sp. NPDC049282 TaxID=3364269 RepID=UPI003723BE8B
MTYGWEAAVEAQIRSAQERGEFDNLPGAGRPIPGRNEPYDEGWWIRSFMEREQIPSDLMLPTPLQLRRRIEQLPADLRDLPTEAAVRSYVAVLNAEVVAWLRAPTGPRVVVRPVNVEEAVLRWRADRRPAAGATPPERSQPPAERPARTRRRWRWWRR